MAKYEKNPDVIAALDEEAFWVTQKSGTERPGTGKYLNNKDPGLYVDVVSGEPLFTSTDKFDSRCGWPSFTKPVTQDFVTEVLRVGSTDSELGSVARVHADPVRRHLGCPSGACILTLTHDPPKWRFVFLVECLWLGTPPLY